MDEPTLVFLIEAALFSSLTPMTAEALQRLFEEGEQRPALGEIRQALKALGAMYEGRGIGLKEVASGFRFQVSEIASPFIGKMHEIRPQRYSRALMETLALIAYRQPITRAEIEDIRGVAVSTQIIKTLLDHNWIRVVGYKEVPGRPGLYATTKYFLDHFNLKSLEELPQLPEIKDLDKAEAKAMSQGQLDIEEELAVESPENALDTVESEVVLEVVSEVVPEVVPGVVKEVVKEEVEDLESHPNPEAIS